VKAVVVALGKVGLPLAAHIARAGHEVVGCDIDPAVVDAVNAATAPFPGEAGLEEALRETVGDGRLTASTRTADAVAAGPDLVVVVPPLVVDSNAHPDWRALEAACRAVGDGLQPGTTVSVETTVPLGTTRGRIAPLLEQASGLMAQRHFHVVFSPERVFSGRIFRDLDTYPKLVGGLSAECEARGVELYDAFISAEVWGMGSAEAAELAKLAETTYRDLNIAFANELALVADANDLDVDRVIAAANSQPFSHIHRPGVAVGGHCIPVYPRFLLAGAPEARLPRVAREINEAMPSYAVDLLGEVMAKRILVLGITYRGGVKETAFSGALALRDELQSRGASEVLGHDPLLSEAELEALDFVPWRGEPVDGAIVQADHEEYRSLGPEDLPAAAIVDGRGVLDPARFDGAVKRLGRP
jgi:UDP-N-acetyl-D-mannosaminuronic acid dehydrogenase